MRTELARPENEYSGVRLTVGADISGARLLVQIDIGFGAQPSTDATPVSQPRRRLRSRQSFLNPRPNKLNGAPFFNEQLSRMHLHRSLS